MKNLCKPRHFILSKIGWKCDYIKRTYFKDYSDCCNSLVEQRLLFKAKTISDQKKISKILNGKEAKHIKYAYYCTMCGKRCSINWKFKHA